MSRPVEPICFHCGHGPGVHTTKSCAWLYRSLDGTREAKCDCPGWKRDEGWPPRPTATVEAR